MSAVLTHDGSVLSVMPTDRPAQPVLSQQTVLLQILARGAQDTTIDLARMKELLEMHERLTRHDAKRQFAEAMAMFKGRAPRILKDKRASMGYGKPEYNYVSLGTVVDAVIGELAAVGISHAWTIRKDGNTVHVTCVLTHKGGHSRRVTLDGPLDNSGAKNQIQQTGSTVTYLQRYTLLSAVGLAAEDDDDGHAGTRQQPRQEQRRDPPPRREPEPIQEAPRASEPVPEPMPESELTDTLTAIRECEDLDTLKNVFAAAQVRARKLKDSAAITALTAAKDARKAELSAPREPGQEG